MGPDGFLDSAAVMESLDLVITADTALAHLAGALGRLAGLHCDMCRIGAGSWAGRTVPGIRSCACSPTRTGRLGRCHGGDGGAAASHSSFLTLFLNAGGQTESHTRCADLFLRFSFIEQRPVRVWRPRTYIIAHYCASPH